MRGVTALVARPGRHSYLAAAAALLVAGCGPKPQVASTPAGFAASSRDAFTAAAMPTIPAGHQILRIGWRAETGQLQLSGNGAVRTAAPDSLRLDIAASLGLGRSTLIMTGDSVEAQPASAVDQILPDRFALWAAIGIMRAPPGRVTFEKAEDGARELWRTTDAAGRFTVFELSGGRLMSVSRQDGDRVSSQLRLTRDASGQVTRANLVDTPHQFRMQVDVNGREPSEPFAAEIWHVRP